MPKHLLQYIHRLKVCETFTLQDTKDFGRVSFYSTEPVLLVIFSEKKPQKQLLGYGAVMLSHHSGILNDFDPIIVTAVHDKAFNPEKVPELSHDPIYLEKNATSVKTKIYFETCCTEPILDHVKKTVECKTCGNIFHKHCVGII